MNYVFYVDTRAQVKKVVNEQFTNIFTNLLSYRLNAFIKRSYEFQANTLNGLDQKVVLQDGTTTLNICAEPSAPPQTTVNEEMVEKIKVAMSDRYVPENKGQ